MKNNDPDEALKKSHAHSNTKNQPRYIHSSILSTYGGLGSEERLGPGLPGRPVSGQQLGCWRDRHGQNLDPAAVE